MADGTFFQACISIAFVVLLLTGISSIKKRLKRYIKSEGYAANRADAAKPIGAKKV